MIINKEKEVVQLVIDEFKMPVEELEAKLEKALHTDLDCIIDFKLNVISPYIKTLDRFKERFDSIQKTMVICTPNLDWTAQYEQHYFVPTELECYDFIEFERIERNLEFDFNPEDELDSMDE